MPILILVVGLFSIFLGLVSWIGVLPTKRRTGYFSGGVHAEVMPMGFGLVILGVASAYHAVGLGLLGLAIVIAGFVLGMVSPSWMNPRW